MDVDDLADSKTVVDEGILSDSCASNSDEVNSDTTVQASSDSAIDVNYSTINDTCSAACWCRQLRQWITRQFDRNLDVLTIDTYFKLNPDCLAQEDEGDQQREEGSKLMGHSLDPLPSLANISYSFSGPKDRLGKPHGRCILYFPNGRKFIGEFLNGRREGFASLYDRDGDVVLSGKYIDDLLNGIVQIKSGSDGSVLEVLFKNGIAHGPARRFSARGLLLWVGRYRNGYPFGLCWKSGDGRGWTCGVSDILGRISDPNAIYLYPNFHSALQGVWQEDLMKKAKFVNVVGFHIVQGFPLPNAVPSNDKEDYVFDMSTFDRISLRPMLRDPYEAICITCKKSKVTGGGEGIFANRNLPANAVIAFYNGVRFNDCHAFNDWDTNSYKIRLNEKKKQILDIPIESQKLANYSATLAHKINHSFTPNAKFVDFLHPRFGRIVAVKTSCAVKAGSEIYCHYGYNVEDCPRWYKVLHDRTHRLLLKSQELKLHCLELSALKH